jgi:formylglycine-generating enzyme required for sulfatase activity
MREINDYPAWAEACGEDGYGPWADLSVNGVTQRMRWIDPGNFLMGERYAAQRVTITDGFWLADTPCTQAFWLAVVGGENPSHFQKGADAPRRPVECVPMNDDEHGKGVSGFLTALNKRLAEPLARLPREDEWEYACRADTLGVYWWGDAFDPARANTDDTGKKSYDDPEGTTPVDRYLPNPWGLFDMHGNVWEWCSDPWRQRWNQGQPEKGAFAVRGGSWFNHPGGARAAYRNWRRAGDRDRPRGFRFVLRSSSPGPEGGVGAPGAPGRERIKS